MGTGVLVAIGIGFQNVPAEDREDFVEAGETFQIGAVQVRDAAIAIADVRRYQREAEFGVLRDPVSVCIEKGASREVVLPGVNCDFSHIAGQAVGSRSVAERGIGGAAYAHWCRDAIDDLIVPLIEDGKPPIAGGDIRESEVAVLIALSEREVSPIGGPQASIALGVTEGIARAAAVESFIRWPAQT